MNYFNTLYNPNTLHYNMDYNSDGDNYDMWRDLLDPAPTNTFRQYVSTNPLLTAAPCERRLRFVNKRIIELEQLTSETATSVDTQLLQRFINERNVLEEHSNNNHDNKNNSNNN